MSQTFQEVQDPQTLSTLKIFLQGCYFTDDTDNQWRLQKTFETVENYDHAAQVYYVELMNTTGIVLNGIVVWPKGELYLDYRSMLILVQWKIVFSTF